MVRQRMKWHFPLASLRWKAHMIMQIHYVSSDCPPWGQWSETLPEMHRQSAEPLHLIEQSRNVYLKWQWEKPFAFIYHYEENARQNGCGIIKPSVFKWGAPAPHTVWNPPGKWRLTGDPVRPAVRQHFHPLSWLLDACPPRHILSCGIDSSTLMQKWKTPLVPMRETREQVEEKLVSAWLAAFNMKSTGCEAGIQAQQRWCY